MRGLSFAHGKLLQPCDLDLPFQAIATPIRACELRTMKDLKHTAILRALLEAEGDKVVAARLLGIGRTTMYRKLKEKTAKTA